MNRTTDNMQDKTPYGAHDENDADMKLNFFLDNCTPFEINTDKIKLRTYRKIHEYDKKMQRRRIIVRTVSAAACLLLAFVVAVCLYNSRVASTSPLASGEHAVAKSSEKLEKFVVPVGQTRTLVLSDGIKIIANSRSRILYPKTFSGSIREVYVDGEAYFDVAHNASKPFIVHGDGFALKVLGTRFNVNNYRGKQARIVLLNGSVEVTTGKSNKVNMRPDEQLLLSDGNIDSLTSVDTSDCTSWIDGIIVLDGETIVQTASRIENFYGISIVCAPSLSDVRLYGKLELKKDVTDVLKVITRLSGTKFRKTDNTISITR